MAEKKHLIHRATLELKTNVKKREQLEDVLRDTLIENLLPYIEEKLNELDGDTEQWKVLDTLSLDLGNLRPDSVEQDFEERFKELFGQILEQVLPDAIESSTHELLRAFLSSGRIPHDPQKRTPSQLFRESLEEDPERLGDLVRETLTSRESRERWLSQFDDEAVNWVLRQFPGGQEWIKRLSDLVGTEMATHSSDRLRLITRLTQRVLLEYAAQASTLKDVRSIQTKLLREMSFHFNNPDDYERIVKQALIEARNNEVVEAPVESEAEKESARGGWELEAVKHFLRTGSLPQQQVFMSRDQFVQMFLKVAKAHKESVHVELKELIRSGRLGRVMAVVPSAHLIKILESTVPFFSMVWSRLQEVQPVRADVATKTRIANVVEELASRHGSRIDPSEVLDVLTKKGLDEEVVEATSNVGVEPSLQYAMDAFAYYLVHGQIPWWAEHDDGFWSAEIAIGTWIERVTEFLLKGSKQGFVKLVEGALSSPRLRQRLAYELPASALWTVVEHLVPAVGSTSIFKYLEILSSFSSEEKKDPRSSVRDMLYAALSARSTSSDSSFLYGVITETWAGLADVDSAVVYRWLADAIESGALEISPTSPEGEWLLDLADSSGRQEQIRKSLEVWITEKRLSSDRAIAEFTALLKGEKSVHFIPTDQRYFEEVVATALKEDEHQLKTARTLIREYPGARNWIKRTFSDELYKLLVEDEPQDSIGEGVGQHGFTIARLEEYLEDVLKELWVQSHTSTNASASYLVHAVLMRIREVGWVIDQMLVDQVKQLVAERLRTMNLQYEEGKTHDFLSSLVSKTGEDLTSELTSHDFESVEMKEREFHILQDLRELHLVEGWAEEIWSILSTDHTSVGWIRVRKVLARTTDTAQQASTLLEYVVEQYALNESLIVSDAVSSSLIQSLAQDLRGRVKELTVAPDVDQQIEVLQANLDQSSGRRWQSPDPNILYTLHSRLRKKEKNELIKEMVSLVTAEHSWVLFDGYVQPATIDSRFLDFFESPSGKLLVMRFKLSSKEQEALLLLLVELVNMEGSLVQNISQLNSRMIERFDTVSGDIDKVMESGEPSLGQIAHTYDELRRSGKISGLGALLVTAEEGVDQEDWEERVRSYVSSLDGKHVTEEEIRTVVQYFQAHVSIKDTLESSEESSDTPMLETERSAQTINALGQTLLHDIASEAEHRSLAQLMHLIGVKRAQDMLDRMQALLLRSGNSLQRTDLASVLTWTKRGFETAWEREVQRKPAIGEFSSSELQVLKSNFLGALVKRIRASVMHEMSKAQIEEVEAILDEETKEERLVFYKSSPEMIRGALIYFLQYLELPWWAPYEGVTELKRYLGDLDQASRTLIHKEIITLLRQRSWRKQVVAYLTDVGLAGKEIEREVDQLSESDEEGFFRAELEDLNRIVAGNGIRTPLVLATLPGASEPPTSEFIHVLEFVVKSALVENTTDLFAKYLVALISEKPEVWGELLEAGKDFPEVVQNTINQLGAHTSERSDNWQDLDAAREALHPLVSEEDNALIDELWQHPNLWIGSDPESSLKSALRPLLLVIAQQRGAELIDLVNSLLRNPNMETSPVFQAILDLRSDMAEERIEGLSQSEIMVLMWPQLKAFGAQTDLVVQMAHVMRQLGVDDWALATASYVGINMVPDAEDDQIVLEMVEQSLAGIQPEIRKETLGKVAEIVQAIKESDQTVYDHRYTNLEEQASLLPGKELDIKLSQDLFSQVLGNPSFFEEYAATVKKTEQSDLRDIGPQEQKRDWTQIDDEDRIYVPNAGIILVWPFFVNFFRKLGLLEESQFKSEDARDRAIHLIQFLVDGSENNPEHLLVFNKLLCGLDLNAPIGMVDLTKAEKEEAEVFLKTIISRWKEVRATSVRGFQDTFFKRGGFIHQKNEKWYLLVEHKPIDILLTRLPWGLSMVKFPWNEYLILVEWKATN